VSKAYIISLLGIVRYEKLKKRKLCLFARFFGAETWDFMRGAREGKFAV
jgi:hypothetical protein